MKFITDFLEYLFETGAYQGLYKALKAIAQEEHNNHLGTVPKWLLALGEALFPFQVGDHGAGDGLAQALVLDAG